jgi:D-glycero-D-manno-heptose 1,7-bisphosphate phosphatase
VGVGKKIKRAVFFDRDGVLNEAEVRNGLPFPPAAVSEFRITPEAESALKRLRDVDFLLFAVTNQPDVARGAQERAVVEEMNAMLKERLPLDEILVCYHDDSDRCTCRKPLPGMLLDAATRHDVDLKQSYMVGDRWKDVVAGERAGCRTIFIDFGYSEAGPDVRPTVRVASLSKGIEWILNDSKGTDCSV